MYGYDNANISDVSNDASYIIRDMTGTNVTSSLTLLLNRDSRDRTFQYHPRIH